MKAPVDYTPEWLERNHAAWMFYHIWHDFDWVIQGNVPRMEYWDTTLNEPYTYGQGVGQRTYQPQINRAVIEQVRNRLVDSTGVYYEGCFLNAYRSRVDGLNWHADDDPGIDHDYGIAIVTLYPDDVKKGRQIAFREQGVKGAGELLELGQGSLAVMRAGMQQTHFHKIPKASFDCTRRISLTFRKLKQKNA